MSSTVTDPFDLTSRSNNLARRRRVEKLVSVLAILSALGAVVMLVGWFAGTSIANGRGANVRLADSPTAVPALVGLVAYTAILALLRPPGLRHAWAYMRALH